MSFALSLATPNFALIGTDTRVNLFMKDGSVMINDDSPYNILFEDGEQISFGARNRKMGRFISGWIAGVGNQFLVNYAIKSIIKENVRTPERINKVIEKTCEDNYQKIQTLTPEDSSINLTGFLYIYTTANKFKTACFGFRNGMLTDSRNDIYYGFPPDTSYNIQNDVRSRMSSINLPNNMVDVYNIVRLTSQVFHTVSVNSTSVSDIIELAIMVRENQMVNQYHLFKHNIDIISANNSHIAGMLNPVSKSL